MTNIDDQLALFDVPSSSANNKATPQLKKDPERLLDGWVKSRTPKKSIASMLDAVTAALNSGVEYEDIEFLLGRKHLFPSQAKFDITDLRNAYRKLSSEKLLSEKEEIAKKILASWGSRTAVSQSSLRTSVNSVANALLAGANVDEIKYAFSHRTLLASKKKVDDAMLKKALDGVAEDRKAGAASAALFQKWYDKWYEGRYTQPPGQIVPVIKSALLAGIPADKLSSALERIGKAQQVVSAPSLQYALQQVDRIESRKQAAGAHDDLIPIEDMDMMSANSNEDDFREESPWG